MNQVVLQIGIIGAETFQVLTFASKEEAMRQSVVFGCSAESRNGMTSVKGAEYSEILPSGRMCRRVEHIYGIWHYSRCIAVHRVVDVLGNLLVYVLKL